MAFQPETSHHAEADNEATSQREIWGWYSYSLAAEVFAVCGVGSFLPVTLEQLARENGVLRSDGITSCVQPASSMSPRDLRAREESQCVVHILGAEVSTSSFALYTSSLAVLVQTLVLISLGAIADYGGYRKRLLLTFGFTGALASMLFIVVFPGIYLVSSLLTIISVASLGSSFVLLNSFLPLLTSNHPSIRRKLTNDSVALSAFSGEDNGEESMDDDFAANALLDEDFIKTQPGNSSPALTLSNQISSNGVGIGYAAAVLVQMISICIIILYNKLWPSVSQSTLPLRTVLFVVGLWWAAFTLPTAKWLRRRPGPPLPVNLGSGGRFFSSLHYITFAWASLWRTVKVALQLRQVVIYLMGWFLLSDAIATISGTAVLFAKTELELGTVAIALLSITATASGIVGAAVWPIVGRRFSLNSISIVLGCIFMFEFIPLYGLLGFIPFIKSLGFGGLQQPWEIYPLAFILGFVMGGISSYCRSIFGLLIPPGMEAAFYALYAVTDKGSSVIGPAIVARIIDATGQIRMGFWFLAVLMIAPAPFFWLVDIDKGREDGISMTERRKQLSRDIASDD